ncbi:MAG: ABC transporter ATP-binding protein [Clostridiales bacterium]|nr:ABC transporter ATP-binding protein [Clostridiales bacterium]
MTNKSTLKKVLTYISHYRIHLVMSLIFAALSVAMTLYLPILIGKTIDLIIGKGQVDFEKIIDILIKIAILIGLTSLCQWLMNILNNKVTYSVVKDMRETAFDKVTSLPLSYLDGHQHGDIISRIITDVDQFADGLLLGFSQLFTGVLSIVGTLVFMLTVNIKITFVVVLITPLSLLVASFIASRTYTMFTEQSSRRGELTSLINEMIDNQKVVQAFSYEERAQERFDDINEKLGASYLRATFYSSITNPATRFVNGIVYTAVGLTGAIAAINGSMTVGQLTSFLSYANQYTKPFNEISGVVAEFQNALASAARVFDFIEQESIKPDPKNAIELEEVDGRVRLDHVYFSYNPKVSLIEDLNLDVEPGQRIAIVGPTGSGKTTLINLLMRFYDIDKGRIEISGIDIDKITTKSLRTNFGMVLQDTWLKSGTILDNIKYGRPDATYEEVVEAAKSAHAHNFIRRLPDGYNTYITDDGGDLSHGQKQLLSIARVMLSLPPMLILDEATSSIDTRTEIEIQNAFNKMMEGRTTFIVAHRLSTVKEADVILVLKDGNIIEKGSHEELLAKKGFYSKLYNSQFAGTIEGTI